ncbi:unnamed protein product [Rotaria socialis]
MYIYIFYFLTILASIHIHNYQYHSDTKEPSIHRRETGHAYLGAHSTYRPHIDLPVSLGSLWHHQGSSWSREQLLAAHLNFINSKFH